MRTNSVIQSLPMITVHAKDLKSSWVVVVTKPFENTSTSISDLLAMVRAIVEDMIEGQEFRPGFATTSAAVSAVSDESLML